ncbi:unnamed protein product [Rotaria sordida]|uniref:Uncharacterized protein n=1 Tax=Rotaria sordida TaxID=392033 RepID=A0A815RL66_9BILA|nr:unnamed protein product [Rotaria sordida]
MMVSFKRIIDICTYCGQAYEGTDRTEHQKNCLRNPNNKRHRVSVRFSDSSDDRVHQIRQSYEGAYGLCERCHESIDWRHFQDHTRVCEGPSYYRREDVRRSYLDSSHLAARCEHCGVLFMEADLKLHQINCPKMRYLDTMQQHYGSPIRPVTSW